MYVRGSPLPVKCALCNLPTGTTEIPQHSATSAAQWALLVAGADELTSMGMSLLPFAGRVPRTSSVDIVAIGFCQIEN